MARLDVRHRVPLGIFLVVLGTGIVAPGAVPRASGGTRRLAPPHPSLLSRARADRTVVIGSVTAEYGAAADAKVTVAGTWGRAGGWHALRDDELTDFVTMQRLIRRGALWRLYNVNWPVIERRGGALELTPEADASTEAAAGPRAEVLLGTLPRRGRAPRPAFLAVMGRDRADRPRVRKLQVGDPQTHDWAEATLRAAGERTHVRVAQSLAVDLDGDGREERLVAVTPREGGPGAMLLVRAGSSGRDVVGYVLVKGEKTRWVDALSSVEVVAVVDVDGDGLREVLVEVTAPDLAAYHLYAYRGARLREALVWTP